MSVDAFHLPALTDADVQEWVESEGIRWPLLTTDGITRIAAQLRRAGRALKTRSVADIIAVVDRAAARMIESSESHALIERIAAATGYSVEMTQYVVRRMAEDWRAPALHALVDAELGSTDAIDDCVRTRDGRRARATGPQLSTHIFSGNVPGVAVTSVIRALIVKSAVLGKAASGEPFLAAAFARSVHDVDPEIGAALAITYWPGGTDTIEAAAFAASDMVVHYGDAAAVDDVRRRLPRGTRLVEHGPRISFGIVAAHALGDEAAAAALARDVALATATFDQQGCVSPHVVFVQNGGAVEPVRFAQLVDRALEDIANTLPGGAINASNATAVRRARDAAEFRGIAGGGTEVWGPPGLGHTVIFDPVAAFTASCLNRTLTIHPVADTADVLPLVAPFQDVLQSVAIAADSAHIQALQGPLAEAGLSRITTFAALPWPPPTWKHDGRGPLLELVRWTDLET